MRLDFSNSRHHLLFLLVGGFLVYLANATASAFFIVSLPQADGWCLEYVDEVGCADFTNGLEEEKYYFNKEMLDRNQWLVVGTIAFAFLLTLKAFPKKAGQENADRWGMLIVTACLAGILVPALFSFVLPAPARWFPALISEVADARERDAQLQVAKRAAFRQQIRNAQ